MMMLIALAAVAANAPAAPGLQRVEVSYADLDLSRSSERQTLDQRLRLAAEQICDPHVPSTMRDGYDIDGCVAGILARTASARSRAIATAGSRSQQASAQ